VSREDALRGGGEDGCHNLVVPIGPGVEGGVRRDLGVGVDERVRSSEEQGKGEPLLPSDIVPPCQRALRLIRTASKYCRSKTWWVERDAGRPSVIQWLRTAYRLLTPPRMGNGRFAALWVLGSLRSKPSSQFSSHLYRSHSELLSSLWTIMSFQDSLVEPKLRTDCAELLHPLRHPIRKSASAAPKPRDRHAF
jgi:hypothetical protein